MRTGTDGRVYVAQVSGSQISAVDINTGAVETISPKGGDIIAPDDIAFDDQGNIFATEITEGRVSVFRPNGTAQVVCGDMPSANPITIYKGRLFAGECRPGGRIMELDLSGGAPRVILENVPMPNAMEVGPDGLLYIPIMGTNEIWRVSLEGGEPEVVAKDLGVPDAVKFDAEGFIVSTQVASGQVLRINPNTGERKVLATIAPGLDNLTFVDGRIVVSSISGQINEILANGEIRSIVPDGFNWPLGLAFCSDGTLFVADGGFSYALPIGGQPQCLGMFFYPGYPGYVRGVLESAPGEFVVTTSNGTVCRWTPATQTSEVLAEGYDRLYGVAQGGNGELIFVDAAKGEVFALASGKVESIATGLNEPLGVTVAHNGSCYVSEEGAGRVVKITNAGAEPVLDGLIKPQGILAVGDDLFIVDAGSKELIKLNLNSGARDVIASDLPVGAPEGVVPKFLNAIPPLAGPMGPFADITCAPDGTLYLSGDADGTVLAIKSI
ncbi:SMP-30/gluconolactonase/LRE family protein [Halioxenophilus sp. WMMB6]|uniref:SMP-30/gluconolactonase/LRE family protein n=1 Tax=Halioxenophilus sp. WMMB6 TaxID=3073815 RepID=UPI00295E4694|nr:SMP-30/gluconolactonase/LRE family protein [Halioxenophilus sp. WMMB6]